MKSIDEIMNMLDWNNDEEIQKQGVKLGKKVTNFNVFLQPCNCNNPKSIWDNCAEIICSKTSEELIPYLNELIWWIEDINWPGALKIETKLRKMKTDNIVLEKIKKYLEILENIDKEGQWYNNLLSIKNS